MQTLTILGKNPLENPGLALLNACFYGAFTLLLLVDLYVVSLYAKGLNQLALLVEIAP